MCTRTCNEFITIERKQLDNAFQRFINRFPSYFHKTKGWFDKTDAIQFIMILKKGQLDDIFQCLIDRLSDEKENDDVLMKCVELIGKISKKWNENSLISLVGLLEKVSTKLNGKQLYLLMIYLLEEIYTVCSRCIINNIRNIWKREAIDRLKENIQMKNENTLMMNEKNSNNQTANNTNIGLLAFGLMIFISRIQLSCNDNNNINFDDLNELIRYCDKQVIQWTDDNNTMIFHILIWTYRQCHTVVHEAAKSGNLSQFKLILQNHPDIDIMIHVMNINKLHYIWQSKSTLGYCPLLH
ncbi:hypothetical protein RFI_38773 [Reticulomyxa filosa]|uniref:Uncharacterized protein n=1 Tax=Reticulomyxa filosa TaxID=46433 RepID=X6LD85_RETFI|nr:hypothetical protein RFI_38773 [Reticulomyxa filosa]|eukprot:ETN98714.1 hypothetical protein RFI_38773 [Reticulomyxa filosa]